jgi:hypothetical protein
MSFAKGSVLIDLFDDTSLVAAQLRQHGIVYGSFAQRVALRESKPFRAVRSHPMQS